MQAPAGGVRHPRRARRVDGRPASSGSARELWWHARRARHRRAVRSSRPAGRHAGRAIRGHDDAPRRSGRRSRRVDRHHQGLARRPGRGGVIALAMVAAHPVGRRRPPVSNSAPRPPRRGDGRATAPTWPGRSRPSWRSVLAQDAEDVERERLARIVHDGVLQSLAYIHRRGDRRSAARRPARAPSPASRSSACAPWSAACPSTSSTRRSGAGRPQPVPAAGCSRRRWPTLVASGRPVLRCPAVPRTRSSPRSRLRSTTSRKHAGPGAHAWVLARRRRRRHRGHRPRRRRRRLRGADSPRPASRGRLGRLGLDPRPARGPRRHRRLVPHGPGGGTDGRDADSQARRGESHRTSRPRRTASRRSSPLDAEDEPIDDAVHHRRRRRRPPDVARRRRPRPRRRGLPGRRHGRRRAARRSAGLEATRPDVLVLDLNLPGVRRRRGVRAARRRGPAHQDAHPLGERRAPGRARRGQGRRHGVPREVGRARGVRRGGARDGARARRCSPRAWPGWCSASSGGWQHAGTGAPGRPRDPRAHRARDRGAASSSRPG